ncbi:MAG: hydrogenase expression/formation protein HypE [Candidatus Nanoarchaeia archaeon]
MTENVTLNHGSGGKEMQKFIDDIKKRFPESVNWKNTDNDASVLPLGNDNNLVFTTDSFTVSPLFFPGGDIGDLAFSGTVNDLLMMGAQVSGLSLGLIIEEGFSRKKLDKIIKTIGRLSEETSIPVVTGDTKVVEKNTLQEIVINTSGVGFADNDKLLDKEAEAGDKIIISGGIGEHAVALLSKRFDYETEIVTDSKPLVKEFSSVRGLIKQARDPTRGGVAAVLNEISEYNNRGMLIYENKIPIKKEVRVVTEILGLDVYQLACEGVFVCICSKENSEKVVNKLKRFNNEASIIGEVTSTKKVVLQTELGKRTMHVPQGRLIPRIC